MEYIEHYYQDIQGWFNFGDLYKSMVEKCENSLSYHFVEVGVWKGKSAVFMATEINNQSKNIKFDCVDAWTGSDEHRDRNNPSYDPLCEIPDGLYLNFLSNIDKVKHIINPIRMSSIEASRLYEDESLDFVLIDASHDYENVKNDILSWYPKIKKGGILAGDDYHYTWPGVIQAANEIFGENKELLGTTWYTKKP